MNNFEEYFNEVCKVLAARGFDYLPDRDTTAWYSESGMSATEAAETYIINLMEV